MEQLITFVNTGAWKDARVRANQLKQSNENSDTFWILNSTICQAEGNNTERFSSLIQGLSKNPYNYELYYMLGEYYAETNLDQGIICMEHSLLYCNKEEDYVFINSRIDELVTQGGLKHKLSFIICTQSKIDLLNLCISSIQKTLPRNSYEIVVVAKNDNEDTISALEAKEDIKIVICPSNANFGEACNLGISSATPTNDIMLLHSDTIVTPNSILWLKMGAYQDKEIGAAGSVTNSYDNNQNIEQTFETVNEYIDFSHSINLPSANPYENKVLLSDFGVLLKKTALESVGNITEDYNECILELADLGAALTTQGYKSVLCHNSFIFHFDSCEKDMALFNFDSSIGTAQTKFISKWGFNIKYYSNSRIELINLIKDEKNNHINVLEVGCGCGSSLSKIKYLFPNSTVYGIELMENVSKLGTYMGNIISGNIESMDLPYPPNSLDYILFGDVLEHLHNPSEVIKKLKFYLKPHGKIIASIPNLMHLSVIIPLLKGNFTYTDEGLLDRTHIHFFTRKEIIKMFEENGYLIEHIHSQTCVGAKKFIDDNKDYADMIYNLPDVADPIEFETFQYIVVASV